MEMLLFAGVIILLVLVFDTRKTVASLRAKINELEYGTPPVVRDEPKPEVVPETAAPVPPPVKRAAKIISKPARVVAAIAEPVEPPPEPQAPASPPPSAAKRFEDLIGGKLPIWIGGIALVFAGFFLVRFSIEAGLFGPGARSITATLFGLLLISLSEFGSRIPRFGSFFTDDERIGHSLAGAGIAVLYGTLYMASELYGLLGLPGALAGVIAITILAFVLSQRHGPPTAIMGLLGGFAAPYVAGLGPESVALLLIYLAVFTAGLFGLAIHRGWAWLALLATGGSVIWTTALLFMDIGADIPFVGVFITLLAIGGVLTMARMDKSYGIPPIIMRTLPLGVGLLQLIMLAPLIEFSPMSWLFFAVLSVFAIALAWRDEAMAPAAAGALGLAIAMVGVALSDYGPDRPDLIPAIGFAALFGIAGHVFAMRKKSGQIWALIGLAAPTAMLMVSASLADFDWSDNRWGIACFIVAITTAIMAWRIRNHPPMLAVPLASAITSILLACAVWIWTPDSVNAIITVAIAAGLAAWARFTTSKAITIQSVVAITLSGFFMLFSGAGLVSAVLESLGGKTDLYSYLPNVRPMIIELLLPAAAIIGIAYLFRNLLGNGLGRMVATIGLVGGGAFIYLLLKQPLAIGANQVFIQYGFAERAVFTHLLALAGWLLLRRQWKENLAAPLKTLGIALAAIALFRFIYFDLFLLSPTSVKQALGPAPVANLGTLHYGATALWLWLYAKTTTVTENWPKFIRPLKIATMLAAIAAVMVTVRQAVHGTDIASPPFTSTETYLYSAGLLALAIAWLARGIQTTNALLRISGLLLLTLVTFKVFLVDANQLEGILRILSFLGLGIALIGIGWIYGKVMRSEEAS